MVSDFGKYVWISKAANVPYPNDSESEREEGMIVAIYSLKSINGDESKDLHISFHLIAQKSTEPSLYSVIILETEITDFNFIMQNNDSEDAVDWTKQFRATFSNGLFTW